MKIVLISGPGHHSKDVLDAIIDGTHSIVYLQSYPKFQKSIYRQGKVTEQQGSKFFDLITYLCWGVFSKLKLNKKKLDNILFPYYDRLCSQEIDEKTDLLIAWPQTSLKSIKKAKKMGMKVLLEYPMIHPLSWNRIMKSEYSKWKIEPNRQKNLWPNFQVKRMVEEIELADKINVLSSFAKNSFVENGVSENKLTITNLGIKSSNNQIKKDDTPKDTFVILFVGRVDILKGVHYLLQAFKKLSTPNKELWLVGTPSDEIQKDLKGHNTDNIKILGFKNREELDLLYQKASVLVLPSVQESYGLVMLEALSFGTPVIASKNTGAPDIAEYSENVLLYDYNNVDELVKLFNDLQSSNKDLVEKELSSYFSKQAYIKRYKEIVEKALNDSDGK